MSVTTFTVVGGQMMRQVKDGVVHDFVPDPLGSVVMVQDSSGAAVYRAEYDPYGKVQSETGTNPSSLGYVGTLGYIKDSATISYVRARYLLNNLGRWLTKDPLWPSEPGYVYAGSAPSMSVDPSGEFSFNFCLGFCAPVCVVAVPLCWECVSACEAASTIDELRKLGDKYMKDRGDCINPKADSACFRCPGKGGIGGGKCQNCCLKRHGSTEDGDGERCACWCSRIFEGSGESCGSYPKPKPKPGKGGYCLAI